MEERLAELIYSYKKENKLVDDKFIESAFYIMLEHYQLNSNIKVNNLRFGQLLGYYNKRDVVKIYSKRIIDFYEYYKKEYLETNMTFEYGDYLTTIETISHEVEHAFQVNVLQYEKTAEGIILKSDLDVLNWINYKFQFNMISFFQALKLTLNYKKKYNKLYEYVPMERLASIKSAEISKNIAELLCDENTAKLFTLNYYHAMLAGYNVGLINNKSDCPTKFYLEAQCAAYSWILIEELSRNLSSIERIKLGLKDNDDTLKQKAEKSYKLSLKN